MAHASVLSGTVASVDALYNIRVAKTESSIWVLSQRVLYRWYCTALRTVSLRTLVSRACGFTHDSPHAPAVETVSPFLVRGVVLPRQSPTGSSAVHRRHTFVIFVRTVRVSCVLALHLHFYAYCTNGTVFFFDSSTP